MLGRWPSLEILAKSSKLGVFFCTNPFDLGQQPGNGLPLTGHDLGKVRSKPLGGDLELLVARVVEVVFRGLSHAYPAPRETLPSVL